MRPSSSALSPAVSRAMPSRDEIEDVVGDGVVVGVARGGADAADQVDEHDVAAPPADLQAEREGAVRIEGEGHRRLADPAALAALLDDEPVGLELAHDHRDGLRRQPGQARDLRLRQAAHGGG